MLNFFLYELRISLRHSSTLIFPIFLSLMVITLSVLAIGPEKDLLAKISPALVWIAILLSVLLSSQWLFSQEFDSGILEQYLLLPHSFVAIILVKIFIYWFVSIFPLLLLTPLFALILYMPSDQWGTLMLSILIGSPALCSISALVSALTLSVQRRGVLMILMMVPFYIPILILSMLANNAAADGFAVSGHLALLGAISLFITSICPILSSFSIRINF